MTRVSVRASGHVASGSGAMAPSSASRLGIIAPRCLLCSLGRSDPSRARRIVMSADGIDRRGFLRAAGLTGAAALAGVVRPDRLAWAAALTRAERDRMTPDQIIERMKSGNAHFRKGEGSRQNYLAQQRASAK